MGEGWGQSSLTPCGGLACSIFPASVLLYLTVATVSRKEERGGKVNFPPPTQIFLASFVFGLPSQEGGAGRSSPIQLPPKEAGFPTQAGDSAGVLAGPALKFQGLRSPWRC